ncbi:MAG TPA: ParB/RepB/Spo0J family partition protein [Mollicutes bacterium]|nr:ParB/RepB/Spo0J family partition protein [Mollicutes bacterium]
MNDKYEKEVVSLFIDDIIPNRFQPRLTFDEKALNELADSIKQHGIIQPLVVRKINDKYEIIAGERRYKAAQMAGLQKVPAIVMNLDDNASAEVAIVENIQRKDLSALEEAESYKKLLDRGYLTQEQLAARMGKNQSTISNKLRLLGLSSEVKEALLNGRISERHARSLLNLKNEEDQKAILNKILTNRLTVKQTDEMIKSINNPNNNQNESNRMEVQKQNLIAKENIPNINNPVETLDFNDISSRLSAPIPYIEIPKAKEEEKDVNVSTPPPISIPNEGIQKIDINLIKEEAKDINPEPEKADVNKLLGIVPKNEESTTTTNVEETAEPKPRFITFPDDEENEETNSFPFLKNNNQEQPKPMEAKTFTDSLVAEYRQTNGLSADRNEPVSGDFNSAISAIRDVVTKLEKADFKVNIEELDFENIFQVIIKINKN